MNKKLYTSDDYNNAYLSLDDHQKEAFDNFSIIGYKTKWLYIFAKNKGLITAEEDLLEMDKNEIKSLEENLEWNLIDYTIYPKVNKNVRCKCGRALKHAFTLVLLSTGEVMTLGSTHFKQHTNISEEEAKDIIKNFKKIDLEKVEILDKVIDNIDMDIKSRVNKEFEFPKDMVKQIEVNLPLLDRQINRLIKLGAFSKYEDKINEEKQHVKKDQKQSLPDYSLELLKVKTSDNLINKQSLPKPDFEIEICEVLENLESQAFTLDDTVKYMNYLSYYEKDIPSNEVNLEKLKRIFYKLLGGRATGNLRTNLVEIEDILKRIYYRQFRE